MLQTKTNPLSAKKKPGLYDDVEPQIASPPHSAAPPNAGLGHGSTSSSFSSSSAAGHSSTPGTAPRFKLPKQTAFVADTSSSAAGTLPSSSSSSSLLNTSAANASINAGVSTTETPRRNGGMQDFPAPMAAPQGLFSPARPLGSISQAPSTVRPSVPSTPITGLGTGRPVDADVRVTVFGFPPDRASAVLSEFSTIGQIVLSTTAFPGGNWMHLTFATHAEAQQALYWNGRVLFGTLMIGVLPYSPAADASLSSVRRTVSTAKKLPPQGVPSVQHTELDSTRKRVREPAFEDAAPEPKVSRSLIGNLKDFFFGGF
jgi:hypothetical protein